MASPSRVVRVALVALALAVGAGSVGSALALTRGLRQQVDAASELGLQRPGLVDDLRRSESPVRARLHLARALLGAALEDEPGPERRGRLEEAERLGRSVLSEHPASWEAASIAGAALYLRWSEARDPLLLQEYRRWEQPLLFALDLAPDHRYPARYLAAAYLELWPALSDEKRTLARDLVASAFSDPRAFSYLLDAWLQVASGNAALEPIPDRSWAWAAVRSRAGNRADWSAYCDAWRRERRSLQRELQARLVEAERLAVGGELGRARRELVAIVDAAPVERAFAPLVERALRLLPHGPGQGTPWAPSERWLRWAMEQELAGGGHHLSSESLARLRSLAFPEGPAAPEAAALSAGVELARQRPEQVRAIRERAESQWQPAWAPYHLLEARYHLERGRPDAASRALRRVHHDWRGHPVFHRLAARLGEAVPEGLLAGWRHAEAVARLPLELPEEAATLRLSLATVPAPGAAVAVRWNGATLDCRPAGPGAARFELPLEAEPGLHQLEIETLAGSRIHPTSVELLPPHPPRRPG